MEDFRYVRPSRLLSRTPRPDRGSIATPSPTPSIIRMDPDCAICAAPANSACECESKSLELAIKHAEQRIMQSVYDDIRGWVRAHAQDYILEHFRQLTDRRKAAHAAHLDRITKNAYYNYQSAPHANEMMAAQATLKRGIDQDWQASVQRYPEVLEYYYSLVELTLPGDKEPGVKNPPMSAFTGTRKASRRPLSLQGPPVGFNPDLALPPPPHRMSTPPHQMMVRRPISPPPNMDRRTPGPLGQQPPPARTNRLSYRTGQAGPPPGQYYPPY
ncbi:hypothetical protein TD95_005339 [Thielaviopsis punctulata]|uniref:Uncharacterized protein n=1 Tax=Thielaviopsis punctulata TaxID=72032 RepID=A0A0F4ZKZ2_9PEZI|nr:hypothetical protein TD95_005339 [Thielaviopsis punctulata]